MRISYEVEGAKTVEHELIGIGERALAPEPVLTLIGKAMQQIERELFDAGGKGAWPPLAASTVEAKGDDRILIETERLMDSLTQDGAEGSVFEVHGFELIFGTSVTSDEGAPYPSFLKTGTSRMPARNPLPLPSGADLLKFTKMVQSWLVGAERAEFGTQSWSLGSLDPFGL